MEQDRPPLTRRERYQRELGANIAWGIGSASCHDIPAPVSHVAPEPKLGEPYFKMIVEQTGELTFAPGETEQTPDE